jgi:hypothetical protein
VTPEQQDKVGVVDRRHDRVLADYQGEGDVDRDKR